MKCASCECELTDDWFIIEIKTKKRFFGRGSVIASIAGADGTAPLCGDCFLSISHKLHCAINKTNKTKNHTYKVKGEEIKNFSIKCDGCDCEDVTLSFCPDNDDMYLCIECEENDSDNETIKLTKY